MARKKKRVDYSECDCIACQMIACDSVFLQATTEARPSEDVINAAIRLTADLFVMRKARIATLRAKGVTLKS